MHRCFSASLRTVRAVALAGVLLLGIGHSWAQATQQQEKPAGSDPFAGYHDGLSSFAEKLTASPAQRSAESFKNTLAGLAVPEEFASTRTGSMPVAMKRVQQLRPLLEPILREEGLPPELAAVVLVESGGQATALSPKGARGLWQFMPETARRYGLTVTPQRDERLDVQKSTRAAARYLRDLHGQFGDWRLAFAAYNAGGEAVQRALERNRTNDFRQLISRQSLPLETRQYVPAVVNAMQMFGNTGGKVVAARNVSVGWILYAETHTTTGER